MRVLLTTYGSRGDLEPTVELAVPLMALGAELLVCAPPDSAAAEGCDAPRGNGVMPTGGWR
jgi:vancomycin aglycone glucosyltransferase